MDNQTWYQKMGLQIVFQPKTLASTWYIRDICAHILASIEGLRKHGVSAIENKDDKLAYSIMMTKCIGIIKENRNDPNGMLNGLFVLMDDLKNETPPWLFSLSRWTAHEGEFRELAVKQCIDMISTINTKFLVHD